MKKVVAVLNRILTVVLIAVLLFAGYVFLTVMRTEKGKVPSVFGCSFMQVATGSMEPTIPTGSLIVVRQADPASVKVGDVITFYSPDPLIEDLPNTHRVTAISNEGGSPVFTTQGDASPEEDPYTVRAERLIGVYLFYIPVGKLPEILHSKVFFFFAMLVPLCAVISVEFLRVKKLADSRAESKKEKNDEHKQ